MRDLKNKKKKEKNRITEDTAEVMTNIKKNNNSLTSSNEDDVPAVVCVCVFSLSLLAFLGVNEVLPFGPTDFSLSCYRPLDLDNFSLSFFFFLNPAEK